MTSKRLGNPEGPAEARVKAFPRGLPRQLEFSDFWLKRRAQGKRTKQTEEATAVGSPQQPEITSESCSKADGFKVDVWTETDDRDGIAAPYFIHSIIMLLGAALLH